MIEQDCATFLTISVKRKTGSISVLIDSIDSNLLPIFILYFLFNISQILRCNITFQILGQFLCCRLQILLIILEYHGLIVLLQVIRKHVCVHQSLTTLAKYIDSLFKELYLQKKEKHTIQILSFQNRSYFFLTSIQDILCCCISSIFCFTDAYNLFSNFMDCM